jgi:shikimate kinase
VILIGFMGAGKSCVGRALSAELGWVFEDLDERVEENTGQKIAQIFRESGETEFRRLEHAALKALLRDSGSRREKVIALGGGAFVQEANASLIQAAKIPTAFLDAEVDELWNRCERQSREDAIERPLMENRERFRNLYKQRRPHYLKASLKQETGGKSVGQVVAELIEGLGLRRQS